MTKLISYHGWRLPAPRHEDLLPNELANFGGSQRSVTLLLDRSYSMNGTPMDQVNAGAADFARELSCDPLTRGTVQVQLVTFGGTVECLPFVPIARFSPPTLVAGGTTPLAEALLQGIAGTDAHTQFLRTAEAEVLKPLYFLFSDGEPTSPPDVLHETATLIAQRERSRQGAFYGFGVDQTAVRSLQPLFPRPVHLLGEGNFANFFRILSVSVRHVSSTSTSEDDDLTPIFRNLLRIPRAGDCNA